MNHKLNLILQQSDVIILLQHKEEMVAHEHQVQMLKTEISALNDKIIQRVLNESNNIGSQLHEVKMSKIEETKLHVMIAKLEAKNEKPRNLILISEYSKSQKPKKIPFLRKSNPC